MSAPKQATLYRMVMPGHTCPYGLKSLDLLNRKGYEVEDKHLASREQTDAFKKEHGVETTPQVFINGRRVGGYDDLRKFFGMSVKDKNAVTYTPVIALFAMAAAMALAASWAAFGQLWSIQAAEWFVAFAMCLLALQKLKDVDGFATMFLNYDLLAKRWVRYAYFYPFAEAIAGVLMVAGVGCGCRFRWRCSSGPSGPCRFSRRSMSIAGNSSAPVWAGTATCRWASCP
ncbi:glutaredoxin [Pseudomonas sp. MDMC_285]|nr:glutaredoxin [Pseudomonas sp. MDMC_285]